MSRAKAAPVVRSTRKWFLLLVPIAIACVVASNIHIHSVGATYDYRLPEYAGSPIEDADVTITPEGIVRVASTYVDAEGVPVVVFAAGETGAGQAIVGLEGGGTGFQRKSLVYRTGAYPEEAARLAHQTLKSQFPNTYKPRDAETAPYKFKAAAYQGRLYPMGACDLRL